MQTRKPIPRIIEKFLSNYVPATGGRFAQGLCRKCYAKVFFQVQRDFLKRILRWNAPMRKYFIAFIQNSKIYLREPKNQLGSQRRAQKAGTTRSVLVYSNYLCRNTPRSLIPSKRIVILLSLAKGREARLFRLDEFQCLPRSGPTRLLTSSSPQRTC